MYSSSGRGFTLVELVTTVVLIGIISAMAVPRFLDSDDAFSQRGYTDEVASALRIARRVAVASGCEVRVTLTANTYAADQRTTLPECDSRSGGWNTTVLRSDGSQLLGSAPLGVTLTPASIIVFEPDGGTNIAAPDLVIGPFTIRIEAAGGNVTVTP